jgi:hypothetical protein
VISQRRSGSWWHAISRKQCTTHCWNGYISFVVFNRRSWGKLFPRPLLAGASLGRWSFSFYFFFLSWYKSEVLKTLKEVCVKCSDLWKKSVLNVRNAKYNKTEGAHPGQRVVRR